MELQRQTSQLHNFSNTIVMPRNIEGAPTNSHSKYRETPFTVYIGMSVYAQTRKGKLIEMLHEHGISISYDIVLEVHSLGMLWSASTEDGVVCPPVLREGLFTTAAMDNIDHSPS